MRIQELYTPQEITELAKQRFQEERSLDHLEGWFLAREIAMECDKTFCRRSRLYPDRKNVM